MHEDPAGSQRRKFRSIFVSDVHLGTKHCQAELFSRFLRQHDAEVIYLIGDIIDGWRLKQKFFWPKAHREALRLILKKQNNGSRVVFIPGNHDEHFRPYLGRKVAGVEILDHAIHETVDNRRYFVTHGDQYDVVLQNAKWLAYLGDRFYELALTSNTLLNKVRHHFGLDYWSLGAFAKRHVKSFVNIIGQFETVVSEDVQKRGVDGVICGHIHHAMSREMNGIHYVNTGDWVESCTAVAEHADGSLEVIYWADEVRLPTPVPEPAVEAVLGEQVT